VHIENNEKWIGELAGAWDWWSVSASAGSAATGAGTTAGSWQGTWSATPGSRPGPRFAATAWAWWSGIAATTHWY